MNHKLLKKIKVLPSSELMRSDPEHVIISDETIPKNDYPNAVAPSSSHNETSSIAESTTSVPIPSEERKVPRKSTISSETVLQW